MVSVYIPTALATAEEVVTPCGDQEKVIPPVIEFPFNATVLLTQDNEAGGVILKSGGTMSFFTTITVELIQPPIGLVTNKV